MTTTLQRLEIDLHITVSLIQLYISSQMLFRFFSIKGIVIINFNIMHTTSTNIQRTVNIDAPISLLFPLNCRQRVFPPDFFS